MKLEFDLQMQLKNAEAKALKDREAARERAKSRE